MSQRSTRRKKKKEKTPDYIAYTDNIVAKLLPLLTAQKAGEPSTVATGDAAAAAALPAILKHMEGEAAKRDSEAEAKKRRREEDCPEQEATVQKWGEVDLKDDGVTQINQLLRTKLRGPYGDPQVWFSGEFLKEKVEPVIGAGTHLRHMMGSDRINQKTLRLAHSRQSILELKHFAVNNSGVTRELDQDFSMSKDSESGEQVLSSRVRWSDVTSMYDCIDAALNQIIAVKTIRPWDYQYLAMFRVLHRARMFQEPAKTEKRQVEMVSIDFISV